ncbi:hypothetical protein Lalb_Chr20g0115981 [Lupinus albus]|uniref:Uncharacterized protein n=1 Tax=Lupinus albus TaxID=3870 RepID=A0A6A4NXF2_LUPAL|nr:hypothetical protein Lalb_Chr20g0115981 [Lupinus albus]
MDLVLHFLLKFERQMFSFLAWVSMALGVDPMVVYEFDDGGGEMNKDTGGSEVLVVR